MLAKYDCGNIVIVVIGKAVDSRLCSLVTQAIPGAVPAAAAAMTDRTGRGCQSGQYPQGLSIRWINIYIYI